jgi:hypothetical protein
MKRAVVTLLCVLVSSIPSVAWSQAMAPPDQEKVKVAVEQTQAIKTKIDEAQGGGARFVRTLTNVQIELTLTDQTGTGVPDKKTVSMIVSSGSWGRIRSAGNMPAVGEAPSMVDLNIDARPFVSVEGPVQLELTVIYAPAKTPANDKEPARAQPMRLNQSLTVILQSGKPLAISQAADPVSDRKVIVEVKATVLK